MRVLFQNRPNALTQRGGDTIVMERLAEELVKLGVEVHVDLTTTASPVGFDLVHLLNFATPEFTEQLARRSHEAGVPFVVTALYEDWPLFFNQSQVFAAALRLYVEHGQHQDNWPALAEAARNIEPHPRLENSWTANHAALLFTTGENESVALQRDYGPQTKVSVHHLGCDLSSRPLPAAEFKAKYQVDDFVLCVGRVEMRKNQLMLLKALEESELTLVLAGGGFTYQPEYLQLCQRFARRGRTIFLERLEPEMLGAAFSAAKVHALPSWYELPGLVSIEAARAGANVVTSDFGTARDYLGSYAFYARPDSPSDIRNAVEAAFYAPSKTRDVQLFQSYTWSNTAAEVYAAYRALLSR